jgi:hypothetical protein
MIEQIACRHLREGLTEYLENALPSSRRQGFKAHLAHCGGCRGFLCQMRHIIDALPALPWETMPPGMKQTLLHAVRDRQSP